MNNNLKSYPTEVQRDVMRTLKAYNGCHVEKINNEYKVITGWTLRSSYQEDREVLDTFYKNDIYTKEEQIINYMESFHDYPIEYRGKRDYRMLNEIGNDYTRKFKYDSNGNIILA